MDQAQVSEPRKADEEATEATLPQVNPTAPKGDECHRCGKCCRYILLDDSPRQLEQAYRAWVRSRDKEMGNGGYRCTHEIWLHFPMLIGRCNGKWKNPQGVYKYVYGPCKHLSPSARDHGKGLDDVGRVWDCLLHGDRPDMCRYFPRYRQGKQLQMSSEAAGGENPSYIKGCGFNSDPNDGWDEADFENLDDLDTDDKPLWNGGYKEQVRVQKGDEPSEDKKAVP
jgi:Fe-S-cluster containining protein